MVALEIPHVSSSIRRDVLESSFQSPEVGERTIASIAHRRDPLPGDLPTKTWA